MATLAALPGFRDFYPERLAERAHVMHAWRAVAERYAFREYDGPPLEPLELYTSKSGPEIVEQLYAFEDKGGRAVALRPEMTPTLARMVGARANALRKPVRWYAIPQLFRYERQQRGRLREHFQLNVDIIGESSVTADAELIACAIDIHRELGLGPADVVVRLSDRRLVHAYLAALGIAPERVPAVLGVVDKLERQPEDASLAQLAPIVNSHQAEAILAMPRATLGDVREVLGAGGRELCDDVEHLQSYVDALVPNGKAWLAVDLSIVRGLAYYTGMVFEVFDRAGEFRAICGGGRYDDLLGALGGAVLPALGFGMGDVVLTELLRARGLLPSGDPEVDCWIVADEGVPVTTVLAEARRIRAEGRSVEYALRHQSVSKQRKAARAAGAREIVQLPAEGRGGDEVTGTDTTDG